MSPLARESIVPAVAGKVGVVAPAATVTEGCAGSNDGLLLTSVTSAPPVGAAPERLTIQVDVWLEATLVGLQVRLVSVGSGGRIMTVKEIQKPLTHAVRTTL